MPTGPRLEFRRRPSVAAYMLRALHPAALRRPGPFPAFEVRWRQARPDRRRLGEFLRLTGLPDEGVLPALYPQALTFPMQLVILTHPACPIPIWRVLQVRNHMLQHRAIPQDTDLDFEARVSSQRVLEKGMELDIHVAARSGGETAWESLTTYYYRGRYGQGGPASPWSDAPAVPSSEIARWRTASGGGWRFSGVSGDYNGIHYWARYARLLEFRGALHHPLVLVGQCLARLPTSPTRAQRLDAWLKGPVYYGCDVALHASGEPPALTFALRARDDGRPAILGRWRAVGSESRLLDEGDSLAASVV